MGFTNGISEMNTLVCDIETTGFDVDKDNILCVGAKVNDRNIEVEDRIDLLMDFPNPLRDYLIDPDTLKIGQNIAFDLKFLKTKFGWDFCGPFYDTEIAAHHLDPHEPKKLEHLTEKYLGQKDFIRHRDLLGSGHKKTTMKDVHIKDVMEMCRQHVGQTWGLYNYFTSRNGHNDFMNEVEFGLIPVVVDMELNGFRVDPDINKFKTTLDKIRQDIVNKYPGINLASPKQIREYMMLKGYSKALSTYVTHGQAPSTNKLALKKMVKKVPMAVDLLKHREVSKLLGTYVNPMCETNQWRGGFNQVGTITGRFSSSKPNLQNIPKRSKLGQQVRNYLVPQTGKKFIIMDLAQIEPRLYAFFSQDPDLIKIFTAGEDFYTKLGQKAFKTAALTVPQRFIMKQTALATLYGAGVPRLREELFKEDIDMSWTEVSDIRNNIIRGFPLSTFWASRYHTEANTIGYVQTLLGRRIPVAKGMNVVNTKVQASQADIIKVIMGNVHKAGHKIVCQVHDEIVVESDMNVEQRAKDIEDTATTSVRLEGMPIKAEVKIQDSWGGK